MTVTATSAVKAAVAVGRRHDLVVAWPRVLHVGANVVVHLAPAPVVARVAAATAPVRPDPGAQLDLEVSLARWAAAHGGQVLAPCRGDVAGPHTHDGHTVSLWPLVHPVVFADDPVAVGESLADLHAVLAGYDGDLPGPERIAADAARIAQLLGRLGLLGDGDVAAITDESREVVAEIRSLDRSRWQPLHGDPHPRNAVLDDTATHGVRWWDCEDAWRGPVEFELAVLLRSARIDGEAAVAAYLAAAGHRVDQRALDACLRLRTVQQLAWPPWLDHYRGAS